MVYPPLQSEASEVAAFICLFENSEPDMTRTVKSSPSRASKPIALLLSACLLHAVPLSAGTSQPLGFVDDQPLERNLSGTLPGVVQFAQTHTIAPAGNSLQEKPTLVSEREALVIFMPADPIDVADWANVRVKAFRNGTLLGELVLAPPQVFPESDQTNSDDRPRVQYSTRAWSANLPWSWVKPGLSLQFVHNNRTSTLAATAIEFAAPAELVLQNIRIGMLTDPVPASANWFEMETARAAIDYFQKIPVAKLTVGHYLPVRLGSVTLPNGTVYKTASSGNGGVHEGDMREHIGKALISTGINLANYGVPDSAGSSQNHPNYFRQTVIHQSVGMYANGRVRHGLSGGNGMATLYDLHGNEFSHELGHGYGLGHYPGGGRWSSHHMDSGWGYDAFRHRMLGNLAWRKTVGANNIEGYSTPSFKGLYRFGKDPMAGGEPDSLISRYTLHTGYTAKRAQAHLGKYVYRPQQPERSGIPVVTLVGFYDPQGILPTTLYPAMYGNYGHTYKLPVPATTDCGLGVQTASGRIMVKLSSTRIKAGEMNKFHVNIPADSKPSFALVSCLIQGTQRTLGSLTITPPPAALPEPVVVGKADGYRSALLFPQIASLVGTKTFASRPELETTLRNTYGEMLRWSSKGIGDIGSLYVYDNPNTRRREYFQLKTSRYGYFPTDGKDNAHWRYLGNAEAHVKPLR